MKELKPGDRIHAYYNDTDYVTGTLKERHESGVVIHADGDPENAERVFPAGSKIRKLKPKGEKPAASAA